MGNPHEVNKMQRSLDILIPTEAGVESYKFWDVELAECKGTPVLGNGGRKENIYNLDLKDDIWK